MQHQEETLNRVTLRTSIARKGATLAGQLFPGARFTMPPDDGAVYLTFDDGPHPESTPRLLELLAKHEAKATFFCLGQNVEKYPGLYEQIIAAGHSTGNHSWSHPNGWRTTTRNYLADVDRAAGVIDTNLFRPPYGRLTPGQYQKLKKRYNIIMWTRLFPDYHPGFNPATTNHAGIRPGDILVMHDTPGTVDKAHMLTEKIQNTTRQQYVFSEIPSFQMLQ